MVQVNGCGRKTMHTASMHSILLKVIEWFGIMMDTQVIDVVTFDFKGTRVL